MSSFMFNERYRDLAKQHELRRRLEQAGLPEQPSSARQE